MAITDDRYLLSDLQHYQRNRSLLYLELKSFERGVRGMVRQIVSPELICDYCQRVADVRFPGENTGAESVLLMEGFTQTFRSRDRRTGNCGRSVGVCSQAFSL
jgi:hypothetical protein